MFMFKALEVLNELRLFVPEMVAACEEAFQKGKEDLDFFRLDEKAFSACPSDSIDYAVMEKTDKGAVIPFQAEWDDLGSWDALWHVGGKDEYKNVVRGDVLTHDVSDSYLHANTRLVAAVGLENHIVVETADAVLVSPRDRVQDVKKLVEKLRSGDRKETVSHQKIYRPWGSVESIADTGYSKVNRIKVKPGARLSLQKHFHRAEHWIVIRGAASVLKGDDSFALREDESTFIPMGVVHRLENPGKVFLDIIEVQTGGYLGEDDIVRLEDDYGR